MKRLVIITVHFQGKVNQKLIELAPDADGKFRVPVRFLDNMAFELGANGSQTYSY